MREGIGGDERGWRGDGRVMYVLFLFFFSFLFVNEIRLLVLLLGVKEERVGIDGRHAQHVEQKF